VFSLSVRPDYRASARIAAAAFSAIITTGALVLPDTSVGMMPQSMTRSASQPCTLSPASTTARMEDRAARIADELEELVVGARFRPGPVFAGDERREDARRREPPRQPHARDHRGAIVGRIQVVGLHRRCGERIGGRQPDVAARLRAQLAHRHREAGERVDG